MKKIIASALVIIMALSLAACSDKKADKELAKVGETVITSVQLDEYFSLMTYLQGMDVTQFPEETVTELKGELLRNMVEMEAMEQFYKGSEALPPTAEEDLKKFIADSKAQEEVGTFLKANNISDDTLANFFYSQFYAEAFYEEVEKTMPTLEEDSKANYEKNKEQYKADQIRASHILFKKEDKATAEKVLKDLRAGTVTFENMAKEHGTDGTKDAGGDLGFFGKGQMVAEFEKAAFAMEKGSVSDLVETEFGYHIIKLTDKREYTPYEEVKDQIKTELTTPAYTKKMDEVLKDLGVEYFTDLKPASIVPEKEKNSQDNKTEKSTGAAAETDQKADPKEKTGDE